MARLLVVLALALCLAPAVVYGQFGRQGDIFTLHHSLLLAAGTTGTFFATSNNAPGIINGTTTNTLELGTNYTFIFAADTDWELHQAIFTSDPTGGNGIQLTASTLAPSVPLGPWPGLGLNTKDFGFILSFTVSTLLTGKSVWLQSPVTAGQGIKWGLVAQAPNGTAAIATTDVFIADPNFGRAGDVFTVHHSLLLANGTGKLQFSKAVGFPTQTPVNLTLEGGTLYTFIFSTDTNWTFHSLFFTSDATIGTALPTAVTNLPLGPWPGATGAGTTLQFVIPTAQIGKTLFVQGNNPGEGFPVTIVSQAAPLLLSNTPPAQDPTPFPVPIVLAAGATVTATATGTVIASSTAGSSAVKGNGAESSAPLAFASIVALSLALATASKYL